MTKAEQDYFDLHVEEYLELLQTDSFVIQDNDTVNTFKSDGSSIGNFFVKYQEELSKTIFNNQQYANKKKYFKARAKIIDYLSEPTHDLRNIPLMADSTIDYFKRNKDDQFRFVSTDMTETCDFNFESALDRYNKYCHYVKNGTTYNIDNIRNACAKDFAEIIEKGYKTLIVYDDFSKNQSFNYSPRDRGKLNHWRNGNRAPAFIGSYQWRNFIDENLSSAKTVKNIISNNNSTDQRASIPDSALSRSGHALYQLYRLLGPISKTLCNSEFYVQDPNNKGTKQIAVCGILDDGFTYKKAGTRDTEDKLKSTNDTFVEARYADIDLNNVNEEELLFLKRLATALTAYCNYLFPHTGVYDEMKFDAQAMSTLNNNPNFNNLNKINKHYLYSYFSQTEIDELDKYCSKITDEDKKNKFVNLTIFFKHYIDTFNMKLEFNDSVYENIFKYFDCIEGFDLFTGISDTLFDNDYFKEESNINGIKQTIESRQTLSDSLIGDVEASDFKTGKNNVEVIHEGKPNDFRTMPEILEDILDFYDQKAKDKAGKEQLASEGLTHSQTMHISNKKFRTIDDPNRYLYKKIYKKSMPNSLYDTSKQNGEYRGFNGGVHMHVDPTKPDVDEILNNDVMNQGLK